MKFNEWADLVRGYDDAELLRRMKIKRPSWPCGEHRWNQWKLALRAEATRRGLLGGVSVVSRDP